MSPVWAVLIVVAAGSIAVTTMLVVRRRAPEGSWFADGDRASGVFGVLATGFSILLGLIVVIAFTSYDDTRRGAETEALVVGQQYETAQFMPVAVRERFAAELVCYARYVVETAWPELEAGRRADLNPWSAALFKTLKDTDPKTPVEQAAYGKWLDQVSDREAARQDRVHGAEGVIPTPLWVVLFFIALTIFAFMLFFADRGEHHVVQGMLIGGVITVIAAMMLLISYLDDPYRKGFGGLQPVAMTRTLRVLEAERRIAGEPRAVPCKQKGEAL